MKLLVILLFGLMSTRSLRSEEFFATASEALILGEIALKQNKFEIKDLILIRMEIRGAPQKSGNWEGPYKAIYEQMGDRPSWLLFYKSKDSFTTDSLYIHEYTVILLFKNRSGGRGSWRLSRGMTRNSQTTRNERTSRDREGLAALPCARR